MPGLFGGSSGDIRVQVESTSTSRFHTFRIFIARFPVSNVRGAVLILVGSAILVPFIACHRSPGPDVVATVNGKDIPRGDLDRAYQSLRISQGPSPQEPSPEQAKLMPL